MFSGKLSRTLGRDSISQPNECQARALSTMPRSGIYIYIYSVSISFSAVRLLLRSFRGSNFTCQLLRISFVFLPSLGYSSEIPLPFACRFSACPSFCFAGLNIVTCGSPFLLSIRFVRCRFGASNAFICNSFMCVEFFSLVFLCLWQFYFQILLTYGAATSFSYSCKLFVYIFLLSRLSVVEFLFHFGLHSTVSLSMFRILAFVYPSFMSRFVK